MESNLRSPGSRLRNRLRLMPPVPRDGLWDHQHRVTVNLEQSLEANCRCRITIVDVCPLEMRNRYIRLSALS